MIKICNHNEEWLIPVIKNKKVSKKYIRSINIEIVVDSLNKDISDYKRNIFLMIILCRLYNRKMKLLYEECLHAMHLLSTTIHKNNRISKVASNNNITLSLENKNFMIGEETFNLEYDDIIDKPESLLDTFNNNEIINKSDSLFETFNNDLVNISSVEQGRDASTMIIDNSDFKPKRRKEFEDQVTELCLQNLKIGFTRHEKFKKKDISALMNNINLEIDTKLKTFFDNQKNITEIENVRQNSTLTDNTFTNFTLNEINNLSNEIFINDPINITENKSEELVDSTKSDLFNFLTLPKTFEFNQLTSKYTKQMKSLCFFSLLNLAANNKVKIYQDNHFKPINCTVIF